ncbi:MAG: Tic20 family protein [Prochlorococcaceae cyanobacterium]
MAEPPIWQRLLALLAYLLPWSEGVPFGRSLYGMFPVLQWLSLPVIPVVLLQRLVPFGGFLLFLLLFLAVVRNPKVPYFIRFNVLQAILLDIVLVLLSLAFNVLLTPLGASFAIRTLSNTVYLGTLVLVLFAAVQCVRGKEADIPTVSEAVRMQLY